MEATFKMSEKELLRIRVIGRVIDKIYTQEKASKKLGLSIRQIKRLCKKFKHEGASGIIHKKRGQPSINHIAESKRQKVAEIISTKYCDFGPTLAMEMLQKNHGHSFSKEWVRQLMICEGLWKPKKMQDKKIYQLRNRRSCFGELIQTDGSYHLWFEDRGPKCCLLILIDDATSFIGEMRFVKHESTEAYFAATLRYFKRYGLPGSFYVDKYSVFRINTKTSEKTLFLTQFARAMKSLNVDIIYAQSPQAKGRVERAFGILQDRLIKMLRLHNISRMEEGNLFLESFRKEYNEKFSKVPASEIDRHEKAPSPEKLKQILCVHEERTISKSLTISFENRLLQIIPQNNARKLVGSKVKVICLASGEIQLMSNNMKLQYQEYDQTPYQKPEMSRKYLDAFLDRKPPMSAITRHRRLATGRL